MKENVLIAFFGEKTNRYYRLFSTKDLPCLDISGIRMHCVDIGVKKSIESMVQSLAPLKGKILDCCTGLGYAAIMLAQEPHVQKVFSFEKDENVLRIAKQNQFSSRLFSNKKIVLENKNILEAIKDFPDASIDAILHDPPRFSIARELYGSEFYSQLFRVLKSGGKLFHYTGTPGEKKGQDFPASIQKRLEAIGFKKVKLSENVAGLVAEK